MAAASPPPLPPPSNGRTNLGVFHNVPLWERKPLTLFIQDTPVCMAVLDALKARQDNLLDSMKLVHVNTLTRTTAPSFLRGVPTLYCAEMPQGQRVFEGNMAARVLAAMKPPQQGGKKPFKSIDLRHFRRTTGSGAVPVLCNRMTRQPVDGRASQRASAEQRILKARLAAKQSEYRGMTMKQKVAAMAEARRLSDERIAAMQAAHSRTSSKFLDAKRSE